MTRILETSSKALLPEWLLRMKTDLPERDFRYEALKYLTRYKNYQLQYIEGAFAICVRRDEIEEKRRKKRGEATTR